MLTQEPNTNKFSRVGAGCWDAFSQCRSGGRSTSHELSSKAEKSWSASFLVLSWAGGENKKKSQPTNTTIGHRQDIMTRPSPRHQDGINGSQATQRDLNGANPVAGCLWLG